MLVDQLVTHTTPVYLGSSCDQTPRPVAEEKCEPRGQTSAMAYEGLHRVHQRKSADLSNIT